MWFSNLTFNLKNRFKKLVSVSILAVNTVDNKY